MEDRRGDVHAALARWPAGGGLIKGCEPNPRFPGVELVKGSAGWPSTGGEPAPVDAARQPVARTCSCVASGRYSDRSATAALEAEQGGGGAGLELEEGAGALLELEPGTAAALLHLEEAVAERSEYSRSPRSWPPRADGRVGRRWFTTVYRPTRASLDELSPGSAGSATSLDEPATRRPPASAMNVSTRSSTSTWTPSTPPSRRGTGPSCATRTVIVGGATAGAACRPITPGASSARGGLGSAASVPGLRPTTRMFSTVSAAVMENFRRIPPRRWSRSTRRSSKSGARGAGWGPRADRRAGCAPRPPTSRGSTARSAWPPPRWPSWQAAGPSPTACVWSYPRRGSPRSCTPLNVGELSRRGEARPCCTGSAWSPSGTSRTPRCAPCSARSASGWAPSSTSSPGGATEGRSPPARSMCSVTAVTPTSRWGRRKPSAATSTTAR